MIKSLKYSGLRKISSPSLFTFLIPNHLTYIIPKLTIKKAIFFPFPNKKEKFLLKIKNNARYDNFIGQYYYILYLKEDISFLLAVFFSIFVFIKVLNRPIFISINGCIF